MQIHQKLLSPITIGGRTARNRVFHAPMSVGYANLDGSITQANIEHYARRAQGGVGMVLTENVAVNRSGRQMAKQPMLADEGYIDGFRKLASEIQRHGALAVLQIVHSGRYAGPWDQYEERRRLAPSAVPFPLLPGRTVTPQEITEAEIAESIAAFANTARLAEAAGFDGVEIHGAQGFLVASFTSPRMNQRADRWGGSFENRIRFALEVVGAVRAVTSPGFLVGYHLMSDELMPGGWSVADSVQLAPRLAEAGVSFIVPVVSTFESLRAPHNAGLFGRPLFQQAETLAVKRSVSIPVFANGGLSEPAIGERLLADGEADAIGLARPLFTDPDWVAKVAEGRPETLRRCACETSMCLRTQLAGSVCECWPEAVQQKGYLGYGD